MYFCPKRTGAGLGLSKQPKRETFNHVFEHLQLQSAFSSRTAKLITSLIAFLLTTMRAELSKELEKAASLPCSWHHSLQVIADQLYKLEEMKKTITLYS